MCKAATLAMRQYDVCLRVNGKLDWICGMYVDNLQRAITDAKRVANGGEFVEYACYGIDNGKWIEIDTNERV